MRRIQFSKHVSDRCLLATAILLTSVFTGCGGEEAVDNTPKGSVKGKVTVDGEPFAEGSVRFTSTQSVSEAFGAEMQAGGTFEVAAPIPTGSYKVTLSPPEFGPIKGDDGQMRPPTAEEMENNVPEKYRTPEASDETVEVKEGDNDFAIDLKP